MQCDPEEPRKRVESDGRMHLSRDRDDDGGITNIIFCSVDADRSVLPQ